MERSSVMPCYNFITIGRLSNNDGDADKNGKKSDSHKISHVYLSQLEFLENSVLQYYWYFALQQVLCL